MANVSFNQMRLDIGLLTPCTAEENRQYNELLKSGGQLPQDIFNSPYADQNGNPAFYKPDPTVPSGGEQQYTLMRISKDLHFISTILKVSLVLGIIGAVFSLVISSLN